MTTAANQAGVIADITNSVGFIQQIGVFHHILVAIKIVDTNTNIEDKVLEVELILDITGSINRGERREIAVLAIRRIEELVKTPVGTIVKLTGMVVTNIRDISVTAVVELIRGEHVKTTGFHEIVRHVAVDVNPSALKFGSRSARKIIFLKVFTECLVKIGLLVGVKTTVVVDIKLRSHPSLMRIVFIHLGNMGIGNVAHQCPDAIGTHRVGGAPGLVILETNFNLMPKNVGRGLCLQVEEVGLRSGIAGTLDTNVRNKTVDARRGVTVVEAFELTDIIHR